jgi:amidase
MVETPGRSAKPAALSRISDLFTWPATRLAAATRAREVSAVEVMAAFLDHIEAVNPAVNAIVSMQPREALLAQARAADEALARDPAACGPLHGLPHAVKDLDPVKGLTFTQGSPIFAGRVAGADSVMVERLRAAGAIFIGKTNTPEWGLGSHTYNPVFGATGNAWAADRSAGGSSGGAAVALALRMAPLADGGDYGGSLRNPAGWNNVFGFRTSFGRVPQVTPGVRTPWDWAPTMGVGGPMARTVADLALLLSVQAGWDARAPLSLEGDGKVFATAVDGDVMAWARGKRIGWLGDFGGSAPHEAGVLELCRGALKTFESLGCVVEDAAVDVAPEPVWQAFIRLRHWHAGFALGAVAADPARRALMKPEALWEVDEGAKLSARDVAEASLTRGHWSDAVRRLFERHDFLVAPTAQVFPFPITWDWPKAIAGQTMESYHEWMKANCLITMAGAPALACPAGFDDRVLPMGIQIVGPVRGELVCLKVAAAYEAAIPEIVGRLPPVIGS